MLWLRKIAQSFSDTQYWGNQFLENNPDYQPQFNVFQSSDFPHVFLGGEDDLQEAEQMAGQPICKVVDCRDLPEIDQAAWEYPEFLMVQQKFDAKVNDLIQKISNTSCPIFVHCALGANRSVAVLAAALTQLTNKPVNQVLSEMKQARAFVGPQDPYYLMALQQSPSETPQHKQQVFDELDQDFPLIQPGLPTNTAQTEIPPDFPDDLLGDMNLLHEEKQWRRAVSTPGSLVTHDDYGWTGKVIELRGDPVNDGKVLVEYPLSAQEAEHLGADEGYVVQRFHRPLDLSPTMQLASPFRRSSSWLQRIAQQFSDEQLTDEDFITADGDSLYADGDSGEYNHDMRAMEHIISMSDLPAEEMNLNHEDLNDEQLRQIEGFYPGFTESVRGGKLLPKEFAVRHMGWIRVADNRFEVAQVNENALQRIANYAYERIQGNPNIELTINEWNTQAYVSMGLLELAEALQAGQASVKYRMLTRRPTGLY